eukprot:TRINITY_DN361_c0_g1_i3.p1 TRINITY_DN361_c0_g1~~TRINITY_DN361_c0_g1_i3.p1  ORF type:complete len:173 (+),score=40.69 TRINITY_DN361_c0_g1_i3:144-662(+)
MDMFDIAAEDPSPTSSPPSVLFTKSHVEELKHAFRRFDRNGDGSISASEIKDVLHCIGVQATEEEIASMIQAADVDGNGAVDFEEFLQLNASAFKMESSGSTEILRTVFEMFDLDKNGYISADELFVVMANLGEEGLTRDECQRMIQGVDTDGNGFVDFEEFEKMMQSSFAL